MASIIDVPVALPLLESIRSTAMAIQHAECAVTAETACMGPSIQGDAPWIHRRMSSSSMHRDAPST